MKDKKNQDYATVQEWKDQGLKLFGSVDPFDWSWKCPACKRQQTMEEFREFKDQGADPNTAYSQCRGRFTGGRKGPDKCDWAAYGLFRGPVVVTDGDEKVFVFDFWQDD